jgi:hypothetical protein
MSLRIKKEFTRIKFKDVTTYPVYGKYEYHSEVVKFFAPRIGINVNGANHPKGYFSRTWVEGAWFYHDPTPKEKAVQCDCKTRNCNNCQGPQP